MRKSHLEGALINFVTSCLEENLASIRLVHRTSMTGATKAATKSCLQRRLLLARCTAHICKAFTSCSCDPRCLSHILIVSFQFQQLAHDSTNTICMMQANKWCIPPSAIPLKQPCQVQRALLSLRCRSRSCQRRASSHSDQKTAATTIASIRAVQNSRPSKSASSGLNAALR